MGCALRRNKMHVHLYFAEGMPIKSEKLICVYVCIGVHICQPKFTYNH